MDDFHGDLILDDHDHFVYFLMKDNKHDGYRYYSLISITSPGRNTFLLEEKIIAALIQIKSFIRLNEKD